MKHAVQSQSVGLDKTFCLSPNCAIRRIFRGRYELLKRAVGQLDVQVPHWKHVLSVSPPCSLRTSYLNVGSSLCGGAFCSVGAVVCAIAFTLEKI